MTNLPTLLASALWIAINDTVDAKNDAYVVPYDSVVLIRQHDNCYTYIIGMEPRVRQDDIEYWKYVAQFNLNSTLKGLGIDDATYVINYDPEEEWGSENVEIEVTITVAR